MNSKFWIFIKNISYTVSSNFVSLLVSTIVVLIIPKLIGVEDYGYWQLYLFYSSYIGFLHFGWNDGIYLRIGGMEYDSLDKSLLFSQFIQLLLSQIFIGILVFVGSFLFIDDHQRVYIINMVAIAMILTNSRLMLYYILQATSRIKEYAWLTMFDRIIYITFITMFLLLGSREFKTLILADIIGKLLSLIVAMYICKDITCRKLSGFYFTFNEITININIGIKLMFSNIASMLIIGIVRFGIERSWDVATFGQISLTLSISNMMMIFINAVGIIIYPVLRKADEKKLSSLYTSMRDFLMVFLLGFLVFYYPLKSVIASWLPQYESSLSYMAFVFPMFIYEGKMALLINTYFKALRREKSILKINILSMFLSLFMTVISTEIFNNLDISILNIVILLAFRSILAEIYLAKELKIIVTKDIILETGMTIIFILTSWFTNSWKTILIYSCAYLFYLIVKKHDLARSKRLVKSLM